MTTLSEASLKILLLTIWFCQAKRDLVVISRFMICGCGLFGTSLFVLYARLRECEMGEARLCTGTFLCVYNRYLLLLVLT
jgi:hypothetical protein